MTNPDGTRGTAEGREAQPRLRRLLLLLVALGAGGMLAELLLLEHYEDAWQWVPLALLATTLLLAGIQLRRTTARTIRAFRAVMALCVLAGGVGVVLHLKGNVEFELERDPELRGGALALEVARGATPALAPGALAQLGLLGLLWAWGHPESRRRIATPG